MMLILCGDLFLYAGGGYQQLLELIYFTKTLQIVETYTVQNPILNVILYSDFIYHHGPRGDLLLL